MPSAAAASRTVSVSRSRAVNASRGSALTLLIRRTPQIAAHDARPAYPLAQCSTPVVEQQRSKCRTAEESHKNAGKCRDWQGTEKCAGVRHLMLNDRTLDGLFVFVAAFALR